MAVLVDTSITGTLITTGTIRSLAVPIGFVGSASYSLVNWSGSYAFSSSCAVTASSIQYFSASQMTGQPLNVLSASFATNSLQSLYATSSISTSYAWTADYANRVNWPLVAGPHLVTLQENGFYTSSRNIPTAVHATNIAVINDVTYIFGGYATNAGTNAIWTSSKGNPDIVNVATGKTLPSVRYYHTLRRIGDTLFIFGGFDQNGAATRTIYTANVSDPTTWTVSPNVMPYPLSAQQMIAVNGERDLWMLGGVSGSSGGYQPFTMSMYATASNPTSWSLMPLTFTHPPSGTMLPHEGFLIGINDKLYFYGGFSGSTGFTNNLNFILTASAFTPNVWGIGAAGTPSLGYLRDAGIIIGNSIYFFGASTQAAATRNIYKVALNSPLTVTTLAAPYTTSRNIGIVQPFIYSGSVWAYGGYDGASMTAIHRCPINDFGPTASVVVDLASDAYYNTASWGTWKSIYNYYDDNFQKMSASVAAQVSVSFSDGNSTLYIPFVVGVGNQQLLVDSVKSMSFNPNTDTLFVSNITASRLYGTASYADNIATASYASFASLSETASYAVSFSLNVTNQYDLSMSYASSSTWASASYTADFAVLSGQALTASRVVSSSNCDTASFALTTRTYIVDYIGVQVFS